MTTTGEFAAERAQLGLRDRDELHEIASAMGVRGATRLRKADLIEAILDKATTGASVPEPTGEKPKKRTTRKKTAESAEPAGAPESGERAAQGETAERADDTDRADRADRAEQAEQAEQKADKADQAPRAERAEPAPEPEGDSPAEPQRLSFERSAAQTAEPSSTGADMTDGHPTAGPSPNQQMSRPREGAEGDGRDGFGEGRSRRRRRRGRDRGGFEGGAPADGGQPPRERERERDREPRPFAPAGAPIEVQGLLETRDEGRGFMRTGGFLARRGD